MRFSSFHCKGVCASKSQLHLQKNAYCFVRINHIAIKHILLLSCALTTNRSLIQVVSEILYKNARAQLRHHTVSRSQLYSFLTGMGSTLENFSRFLQLVREREMSNRVFYEDGYSV